MPAWTAWNCWNGRVPARPAAPQNRSPVLLACGPPGSPLWQDHRRRGPSRRVRAQARRLLGEPWGAPGLTVAGHPGWPDVDAADAEAFGLVSVLVTRQERSGRVRLCGWLVDVYCLGVKDVVGPRVMDERRAADFHSSFFAAYQARPLEAPPELAQHLVFGAVEYARGLGFEPARGFAATIDQLGSWAGPSAIRFGRDGKPFFVQGPHDNATAILTTLERSVGPDNFHFLARA